ncbi:uncharacterized protein LOC131430071 [Malaya genurostris]|uniref:uncharacterized protein LOC131430071 n=1 Tax=Malaya genurostris TaxID=325434 RepID=UPI0026F39539|nr:uncharacterized protein LOC131430071 [Malaya genurostris]XP_058450711.1 uncharacterized protein LOC131430071 [Malaya genurostris]
MEVAEFSPPLGINDMPFEILCDVFDYLPLMDIKTAALVCRRWNQIIFSELYIKRFKMVVSLNESLLRLKQMVQILEKSDRDYYSIILKVNLGSPLTEARLKIVKYVVRLISEYAESLYFNMADLRLESCVSERLLRSRKLQLIDTRAKYIPLGMGLKESMLGAICEYATDLTDLVISDMNINNPKALEKLSLLGQLKLLLISDYYPYTKPTAPPINVPSLENLTLINVTDESNFYFKVDSLKRLFIHTTGTDATRSMQFIANNITNVSRLGVHFSARTIVAQQIFEHLDKFPNLSTFELGGVAIPADALQELNPSNRLQKLILVGCQLETLFLTDLNQKLHCLRQLVFDSCLLFHRLQGFQRVQYDDLEPVRRSWPHLQVLLDYN